MGSCHIDPKHHSGCILTEGFATLPQIRPFVLVLKGLSFFRRELTLLGELSLNSVRCCDLRLNEALLCTVLEESGTVRIDSVGELLAPKRTLCEVVLWHFLLTLRTEIRHAFVPQLPVGRAAFMPITHFHYNVLLQDLLQ